MALWVIMLGTFLGPLDASIVNVALPEIAAEFGVRLTVVSWVSSAYMLANATLILVMGRLGDIWGLRRVYVSGFAVFGLGSLACAFATTVSWLIAARVLQAAGASMMFATGPALVSVVVPAERRGRALGMVSLSVSMGLMTGPPLGGLLVGRFGWPAVFLVNVPLAVVVAGLAYATLPKDKPIREAFDGFGALLGGCSLFCLLFGLSEADRWGWISLPVLALFAGSVVLGVLFLLLENRLREPLLDLNLFASPTFASGAGAAVLCYLAMMSVAFLMPFYLLRVRGLSPEGAGLVLIATPLGMALCAPLAGRLTDRQGTRELASVGLIVLTIALIYLALLRPDTNLASLMVTLFILGAGSALFQTPNTTAILGATPRHRIGIGSAIVGAARSLGMSLGVALTAAIVTCALHNPNLLGQGRQLTPAEGKLFLNGSGIVFLAAAALVLVGSFLAAHRQPGPHPQRK